MSDRRRRQKDNRAARREAERKAAGRKEVVRRIAIAFGMGVALVGAFVVIGLFGSDAATLPGSYEGYRSQPTACGAETPPPEEVMSFPGYSEQPDITPEAEVTATIVTSCGDIVVELDPAGFSETVESFVFLARQEYYDGTVFHRILADYLIEGGDPDATGAGGPGYDVPDEFPGGDFVYEEGVVAMANNGRGTTGSRFFFAVGEDATRLAPLFNVLGNVVGGTDTLDSIAAVATAVRPGSAEQSVPLETVYIEDVVIEVG